MAKSGSLSLAAVAPLVVLCLVLASLCANVIPCVAAKSGSQSNQSELEEVPMPSSQNSELSDLEREVTRLYNEGQFASAIPLAQKAVKLSEELGNEHTEELVAALLNLSSVLQASGDTAEARDCLQRALKTQEKQTGPNHPDVAVVLSKLASLLRSQADYDSAEPLLRRAVEINEKAFGKNSLDLARDVRGLASVLEGKGEPKKALALYEQAEQIIRSILQQCQSAADDTSDKNTNAEEQLAKKVKLELELADVLNDQSAILQQGLNDLPRAGETLAQALEIRQRLLGRDDFEVAELLNNQATLLFKQGKLAEAKAMLEDVAKRYENSVGSVRLDLVTIKNNLGELNQLLGDSTAAQTQFMEAGKIFNEQARQLLPTLSLAEQRAFIDEKVFPELSLLLDSRPSGEQLQNIYEIVYQWKGMLIDAMRRETRINALSGDKNFADTVAKLKRIRSEMAAWFYASIANEPAEWVRKNKALTEEKEQIERQLSRKLNVDPSAHNLSLKDALSVLSDNEVMVDVYSYDSRRKGATGLRYAAILSSKTNSPVMVDLGTSNDINAAVDQWHEDIRISDGKKAWNGIASLVWKPITAALPAATNKVWVCPDDELYRIPWHLFALGEDKPASLAIAEADSLREVVALRTADQSKIAGNSALLVGGCDFNADQNSKTTQASANKLVATTRGATDGDDADGSAEMAMVVEGDDENRAARIKRKAAQQSGGLKMAFLPGTVGEIASIESLAKSSGLAVDKLLGAGASEEAVVPKLSCSSYVHLATHGIFLDDNAIKQVFGPSGTRSIVVRPGKQWSDYSMKRNPLVTSVIALAGANRENASGGLNGILSAEEVVGLDLHRCKLVTLSACETGAGKKVSGQGVMGLRSSFIAAGTRALLISLWKVPDEPTVQLMRDFYDNLWIKKMSKLESLKQAQLNAMKRPYGRLPVNWAAWVLVGE